MLFVVTEGKRYLLKVGKLCKYVIHTVGPKSDRKEGTAGRIFQFLRGNAGFLL